MAVPRRVENSPSDHFSPLLPTTFPFYQESFIAQPNIFYSATSHERGLHWSSDKVAYIEAFWRKEFPGIYPALVAGGLLEEGHLNIARHNIMAGMYAHDLAYLTGLSTIQEVATASGMHDFGKRHENALLAEAMPAKNQRQAILRGLERSKRDDRAVLVELGYPKGIIELMGANVPKKPEATRRGNHTAVSVDTLAETIVSKMSQEQQIIWYVDAMLLDSQPIDIATRFSVTANDESQTDDIRQIRNQAVREALRADYGVDYHKLQLAIGILIEPLIIARIAEHNPDYSYLTTSNITLHDFLQIRLDQRVQVAAQEATPIPSLQAVS